MKYENVQIMDEVKPIIPLSNPWTRKYLSKRSTYWSRCLLKQSNLWMREKLDLHEAWKISSSWNMKNQLSLRTSNAGNYHFTNKVRLMKFKKKIIIIIKNSYIYINEQWTSWAWNLLFIEIKAFVHIMIKENNIH